MLDAVQAGVEELTGVEQLQVRGAGNVVRAADADDRAGARQRQPEVDLERRRPALEIALGQPAGLLGVARDDRVGRVRGMLAVDVRPGGEDARPGQTVVGDHRPQSLELLLPLPRIAKRRDAVAQLPQRHLRVVLDMEMQVDQAGGDRAPGKVDALGLGRHGDLRRGAHGRHAFARDDHAAVLDWPRASAVDDADVVEDDRARRRLPARDCTRHERHACDRHDLSNPPSHLHALRTSLYP